MELRAVQAVAGHLRDHHVRYLVAGGLAVVVHGYARMTFDLDLVIHLESDNLARTFKALEKAGYRPRIPVTPAQLADRSLRQRWVREKGFIALNMWSDTFPDTPVDLLILDSFDFDKADADVLLEHLEDGTPLRVVSLRTLIQMKKAADRAQDREDIEHLEILRDET